jgi:hypothetical protein
MEIGPGLLDGGRPLVAGVDPESDFLEVEHGVPVTVRHGRALGPAKAVDEDIERPAGGNARVELTDGACGGVPGIGEQGQTLGRPLFVEIAEPGARQVHFAPHFEPGWGVAVHLKGDALDGPQVLGDVLPAVAIASGGAGVEAPVDVG